MSLGWFQSAAEHEAARDAAIGLPRRTLHPLLVWNALPRGGASQVGWLAGLLVLHAAKAAVQCKLVGAKGVVCTSPTLIYLQAAAALIINRPSAPLPLHLLLQYHGHAQVLLSEAPFPFLQQEREAVEAYDLTHGSMSRG